MREPPARTIVRIVLIIVAVAICLYLIYQVRRPLTWLFISAFLAIALSGPGQPAHRHMRRGIAITIVYVGLLLVPIALIGADRAAVHHRGQPLRGERAASTRAR